MSVRRNILGAIVSVFMFAGAVHAATLADLVVTITQINGAAVKDANGNYIVPSVVAGDVFTITVDIQNTGGTDATSFYVSAFNSPSYAVFNDNTQTDFTLVPLPAGKLVDTMPKLPDLLTLAAGATTTLDLQMAIQNPGDATISVLVNSQSNVTESNKLNNRFDLRMNSLQPTQDLKVVSMITTNTTLGTDATFEVMIQNLGNTDSVPCKLGFYQSRMAPPTVADVPDFKVDIPAIATGATFSFDAAGANALVLPTQNAPRGGRAYVLADCDQEIAETDETNNVGTAIWGIQNAPVSISSVMKANPSIAALGETVTFTLAAADGNTTTPDPLFYNWNFGDGTTGYTTVPTTTHAYTTQGQYNVTVSVSDGPFNSAMSATSLQVIDSALVDLGYVVLEAGYVKLAIPQPTGLKKGLAFTTRLVEGDPGIHVKYAPTLRLTGTPSPLGQYKFTYEFFSASAKYLKRIRYVYTVLPKL